MLFLLLAKLLVTRSHLRNQNSGADVGTIDVPNRSMIGFQIPASRLRSQMTQSSLTGFHPQWLRWVLKSAKMGGYMAFKFMNLICP